MHRDNVYSEKVFLKLKAKRLLNCSSCLLCSIYQFIADIKIILKTVLAKLKCRQIKVQ